MMTMDDLTRLLLKEYLKAILSKLDDDRPDQAIHLVTELLEKLKK